MQMYQGMYIQTAFFAATAAVYFSFRLSFFCSFVVVEKE